MAKIVNGAGEIIEGTAISDEQIENRDRLAKFFHSHFCGQGFHHATCEKVALKIAIRIGLTPEGKQLLSVLTDENEIERT